MTKSQVIESLRSVALSNERLNKSCADVIGSRGESLANADQQHLPAPTGD